MTFYGRQQEQQQQQAVGSICEEHEVTLINTLLSARSIYLFTTT